MVDQLSREKLARLPKWAQDHILTMYKDRDNTRRTNRVLLTKEGISEARVLLTHFHGVGMDDASDQPLPINQHVRFFPGKMSWSDYVEVHIDRDLERLVIRGADALSVEPMSSNVVHITTRDIL